MESSAIPPKGVPCPGCPIYAHIPDEQFRFPSCELCHWPAIGIGSTHVWRCAYCWHRNEHGMLRPRVVAVLLRLADVDPAARRLDVAGPRYGRYLIPRAGLSPCQPRTPSRTHRENCMDSERVRRGDSMRPGRSGGDPPAGTPGRTGGRGRHRVGAGDREERPVYARATVAGLPVLIVGGDRPYPHPLGLAEDDPEPCAFGSRATRIACPCDQPPPCLHGQALYAHVVSPDAAAAVPSALTMERRPLWPAVPPPTSSQPGDQRSGSAGVVGATRKVSRSQAT